MHFADKIYYKLRLKLLKNIILLNVFDLFAIDHHESNILVIFQQLATSIFNNIFPICWFATVCFVEKKYGLHFVKFVSCLN